MSDRRVACDRLLPADVAGELGAARERLGMSVRTAAALVGISASYVRLLERGGACPTVAVARTLALVLDLDEGTAERLMSAAVPNTERSVRWLRNRRPPGPLTVAILRMLDEARATSTGSGTSASGQRSAVAALERQSGAGGQWREAARLLGGRPDEADPRRARTPRKRLPGRQPKARDRP